MDDDWTWPVFCVVLITLLFVLFAQPLGFNLDLRGLG